MKVDLSGLTEPQRAEHLAKLEVHRMNVHPGRRVARVCPVNECTYRYFGDPEWSCPTHGRGVAQENRPYMGVSTV